MKKFFAYNWQVREEWFTWCTQFTEEELLKERNGGVGSILYTLFHILDVEYSWMRSIMGKEDIVFNFADNNTLEKIRSLSNRMRQETVAFLNTNIDAQKDELVHVPWDGETYKIEDILHHIIAHEIHHIGQLSIWARELGVSPVPANFVGRKLELVHIVDSQNDY